MNPDESRAVRKAVRKCDACGRETIDPHETICLGCGGATRPFVAKMIRKGQPDPRPEPTVDNETIEDEE